LGEAADAEHVPVRGFVENSRRTSAPPPPPLSEGQCDVVCRLVYGMLYVHMLWWRCDALLASDVPKRTGRRFPMDLSRQKIKSPRIPRLKSM
jgi:hypothetical protein